MYNNDRDSNDDPYACGCTEFSTCAMHSARREESDRLLKEREEKDKAKSRKYIPYVEYEDQF